MPTHERSIHTEVRGVESELLALAEPPDWSRAQPLTVERCVAAYDHEHAFTIGVEEELMLVDPRNCDLASAIDEALEVVGNDRRFAGSSGRRRSSSSPRSALRPRTPVASWATRGAT
jgi:hypothetical protein